MELVSSRVFLLTAVSLSPLLDIYPAQQNQALHCLTDTSGPHLPNAYIIASVLATSSMATLVIFSTTELPY